MIKKSIVLFQILFFMLSFNLLADDTPFVRFPAPSPDGSKIAFSFQGDIWTVSLDSGDAKRLTIHQAYESYPKWSLDGKKIAFSSNRFGNNDIFTIPATGGIPKRLTYHSANDVLNQWTTKNTLLFSTARLFRQVERINETYSVKDIGGTPKRILNSLGDMPVLSPDGKNIAFTRGSCRIEREDYKGPANRDIWLYNIEKKEYTKLTIYDGNDFYPRWQDNDTILFISSSSGKYNIHSLQIKDVPGTAVSQKTYFKDFGVRYFGISLDKKIIAMEVETSIYTMDLKSYKPEILKIKIGADYRFDPIERKTMMGKTKEYSVSPNGKLTAFVVRGEVFVKQNDKKKSRTVNLSNHPFMDSNVSWLTDNKLLFTSDRNGVQNIFMVLSDDKDEKNLFKTLKRKIIQITNTKVIESDLMISPDKKKLAFLRGSGKLIIADISNEGVLTNEKTLLDGWASPSGLNWSPDSQWLAYSKSDLNFNSEVFIHKADNSKKPVNISMHPRVDASPVWSKDGSKLGFISQRNNQNYDIWYVWLKKSDWEKTKLDWDNEDGKKEKKKPVKDFKDKNDKKSKKKSTIKPVQIDFENIYERLVQVTSLPGDETSFLFSKDGKTIYFTASLPGTKGNNLFSIKWDKTKMKAIIKGGKNPAGLELDTKGSYIYMLTKGGKLARMSVKGNKFEGMPFKAKMTINHPMENVQIFNDATETLNRRFYDPNFHGKDWLGLQKKYKKLVLKASTSKDFRDMYNNMLGQLNASHMGLYGRDRAKTQRETTGLLGAQISIIPEGALVERVILGSPADKVKSKLAKGDVIVSIDGVIIDDKTNYYSLLNNKVNEQVLLEVKNNKILRTVIIRPKASLRAELYEQWVKERKKLTEKYSNGKLGYLHIRGMDMNSFERFEREITASGYGKKGIIIDVRFNGGGWTTDYLMATLNVKQHSYTVPRGASKNLEKEHKKFREYYAFGERLPFGVWTKPSIAICNENSYSNAEIFSHAYKTLGIGKLVGMPTFGAVISTSGKGLLDGSFVRLPFRAWYVKATDKNMEHGPAVPNIIINNAPDSKANGIDEQLKKSVEVLLKEID